MKAENSNRILPIKSLLQNLKQQTKKQYLQLDNKNSSLHLPQNNAAQRIHNLVNPPLTQRQHPLQDSSHPYTPREHHTKGISLNKQPSKNTNHFVSRESTPVAQFIYPSFHHSKKDKGSFQSTNRFAISNQEHLKNDSEHYHNNNKINKSEHTFYPQYKHQVKDVSKNPQNRLFEEDSFTLSDKMNSKFEEQTRYFSKMESQPIFKDQITKIKTQLYQKQALLFQKTQELQEKDKVISILQKKVQKLESSSKGWTKEKELSETVQTLRKLNEQKENKLSQCIKKIEALQEKTKKQSQQINQLKAELNQTAQEYSRYQEDNSNNFMLYSLKIRQYQAEQKERLFQVQQIKEKDAKVIEHLQKAIKGLSEVVKQKEEIISQLNSKCSAYEKQLQKASMKREGTLNQIENKQIFIRQLSAEVGDLKSNLRNMELRIREMIEEEEELKKALEEKSQLNIKLNQIIQSQATQYAKQQQDLMHSHLLEKQVAEKSMNGLKDEISVLQETIIKVNKSQIQLQSQLKQANKKIGESKDLWKMKQVFQQATIADLKLKVGELNQIVFKRQNTLIAYKEKNMDLQDRLKKATLPLRITPPKMNINPSKLIKDNQRLNAIVKDFDGRLYQSFKLNQSLNQQIAKRQLIMLNRSLSYGFQKDIE